MPKLVDTTIRLLSQEPLAGRLPTAEVLRVAEILDGAGFACLEVSGGGVFDATVRRRVESPWERIRAIKTRVSTPLGIALRGRFLVGSRPVSGDIVGRFVSCAAENGIDVFRLHDPLNDVSNLREAGAAITSAGGAFHAGLVYSPGRTEAKDLLVEQARKLPDLGATRVILNDPTGALVPHKAQELVEPHQGGERASGRLLRAGCRRRGARVRARGRRVRSRSHRDRRLPARAHAASRLRRVGRGVARGSRPRHGARRREALGRGGRHRRVDRRRAGRARRAAHRGARRRVRPAGRARRRARGAPARARGRRPAARGARGGRARSRRGGLAAARGADRPDPRLAGAAPRARGAAVRIGDRRVPRARAGRLRRDTGADRPERRARRRAARAAGRSSPRIR